MATTSLADVIIKSPTFQKYFWEESLNKTRTLLSGIVNIDPRVSAIVSETGKTVRAPFYKPISGTNAQVLGDNVSTKKLDGNHEILAQTIGRVDAYQMQDIIVDSTKYDPAEKLANDMIKAVTEAREKSLYSILEGIVSAPSFAGHIHDPYVDTATASSKKELNLDEFLTATQKMGDDHKELGVALMPSAVYNKLQKQQLITYMRDNEADVMFETFGGRRVVLDDNLPIHTGTNANGYWTFLFKPGVINMGFGQTTAPRFEAERQMLANSGTDTVMWRDLFMMVPTGISWTGTSAKHYPTDAELATGTNWEAKFDLKNIPFVAIRTNVK